VKTIADLKARSSESIPATNNSKTTSQQLAELLLQVRRSPQDEVRIVPAGQSWSEQSSLILTELLMRSWAMSLLPRDCGPPAPYFFLPISPLQKASFPFRGSRFLHAALETRKRNDPKTAKKSGKGVRALKKTLHWIANHSSNELLEDWPYGA